MNRLADSRAIMLMNDNAVARTSRNRNCHCADKRRSASQQAHKNNKIKKRLRKLYMQYHKERTTIEQYITGVIYNRSKY